MSIEKAPALTRSPRGPVAAIVSFLALACLMSGPGVSGAAARTPGWQENITMQIIVDGRSNGRAHLYESEDFQRMLLVLDDLRSAVVFDLPETIVYNIPPDSVRLDADGNAVFNETNEVYLTGLESKDGTIRFDLNSHKVEIQPLPPLIGPTTLARLIELKPSYALAAQSYKPDPAKIAVIKSVAADTEIKVYFGTWCFMCKKLVPPLIRTIGMAQNGNIRLQYIGVDEDLKEPAADIRQDRITRTPTVVVLQGGREIGRIEEKPDETIEADLAKILSGK